MKTLPLLAFLLAGSLLAAEEDRTPAEWVEELTAAYAKLGGFVANYRSVGEAKHLEATLAMDEAAGLGVVRIETNNNGIRRLGRQWSNDNDDFFFDAGDGRVMKLPAMRTMVLDDIRKLADTLKLPGAAARPLDLFLTPELFLSKTEVRMGLGLSARKPAWHDDVSDARLTAIDAETVTFQTTELGMITIGRKHGLLIRQSLTADDGEVRVLELQDLALNPGREAVEKISTPWNIEKAVAMPDGFIQQFSHRLRAAMFQAMVGIVETGAGTLADVEALLEDRRDALREFAANCLTDDGAVLGDDEVKALLESADAAIREFWHQADPLAKHGDEAAFAAFRARTDVRASVRDQVVTALVNLDGGKQALVEPILGPAGMAAVTTANAAGRAAKAAIETTVATAYAEAFLDRAMTTHWGPAAAVRD